MDESWPVEIRPMPRELQPQLRRLLHDYVTEQESLLPAPVPRDSEGLVDYPLLERYWSDPAFVPLRLHVGGEVAGFCLLADAGRRWHIAEFYVRPAYRRRGVGSAAAAQVKDFCRARGEREGIELTTLRAASASQAFWRAQGFVQVAQDETEYTYFLSFM